VLVCCERKLLLAGGGWWLMLVWCEKNIVGWCWSRSAE